jgi:phage tail sheath gpL-like
MTIDASARASALGIGTQFKDLREGGASYLPQRIALFAQGESGVDFSLDKWPATGAGAAGARFGYKSPIYQCLRELQPANGDGVGTIPIDVYPLEDVYEGVAAVGSITPSGTMTEDASYRVRVSGVLSAPFVLDTDDNVATMCDKIVAAINAVLGMPGTASDETTRVDFTAGWAGTSGNDLTLEIIGDVSLGVSFAIVQPTGGLADPAVDDALDLLGEDWTTMILFAGSIADEDALDAFQAEGEGRWDDLVHKPFVCFTGNTIADVTAATAVSSARRDDRVNCQLVAPGSVNLPCVVAARQLARIARVANNNPPKGYKAQRATGLIPGTDGEQWDYAERDLAVKAGSSTVEVKDGVINIADVVTFYRPEGEDPPGFRYVVTIVKLQNCIHNINSEFAKAEWAAAPLVNDDDAVVNPEAKQPKMVKAKANAILAGLGRNAIIAGVKAAQKKTVAVIDSDNPDRVNLTVEFPVSGNTNIVAVTQVFGFNFGGA